ncbi:MAG: PAS domain S-box protein [Planctomycetaceae bacterium]
MPRQSSTNIGLGQAPLRIAGLYACFGLIWIWLSDWLLIWLGYSASHPLIAGAVKGTAFVVITAMLLHWLIRREIAVAQKSETLLRAVVEGTTDAVFVKDSDGRYLLANEAAARFIGKPVDEVLGRDDRQLFGTGDADRIIANDRATMAGGQVVNHEETLTSAGAIRTYHATKAPFRDATGAITGLIGVSRDITERKSIEDALRLSEQQYRALANAIPQIVWTATSDGAVTQVNSKAIEYTGLTVEELSGWSWQKVVHPDDRSDAVTEWTHALKDGVPRTFEMRIRRSDGEYRWHIVREQPLRDAKGVIELWVGTCTDIDDLTRAENALRETETRLREAQRIARLGSWNWEPQTDRVAWSDAEFELFGVSPQDIHPSLESFLSLLHPDDRSIAIARVEGMKAGDSEFANDMRIIRPDGEWIWIHSRARATRDSSGQIIRVEGTDQDITEMVRAKQLLRAERDRIEKLMEAVPVAICSFQLTPDGRMTMPYASPRIEPIYGLSPAELAVDASRIFSFLHPDDRERVQNSVADSARSLTLWRDQFRVLSPEHGEIWIEGCSVPSQTSDGNILWHGYVNDVTDRLRVEEARDELLARLQLHIDRMPIAYVLFDAEIRFANWNPAAEKIFGYSREEIIGQSMHFLVHPEDHLHAEDISRRLLSGDVAAQSINRNVTKDGRVITCEWHNTPLFAANGSFLGVLAMALDITNRVEAEAALRDSERRLRLALEAASSVAFTWDVPNDAVTRYFSTEPALPVTAERTGTLNGVRQHIHPEDLPEFDSRLSACLAGGTEYRNSYRVIRADGTIVTKEEYGYLDRSADGSPLSLTGIIIDITDRIAATEALRISEERLRIALKGARGGVWDWDLSSGHVWWSPEVYELMGAAAGTDTGEASAVELIDERDRLKVQEALADAMARKVDYHCEFRVLGGTRWLSSHARLFCNAAGEPVRLLGITWDISDRMQAMEALRESEMRYRRLIAVLPTAVLVHDGHRVLYSNPAFVRLVGAETADEVAGRPAIDFVSMDDRTLVQERILEMLATGEPVSGTEIRLARLDGRSIPAYSVSTPVTGYGPEAFLVAITDLTDKERATELLRSVLSSVGDAILTIDEKGIIGSATPSAARQFGYTEDELLGQNVSLLMYEPFAQEHDGYLFSYLKTGIAKVIGIGREVECLRRDGTRFSADLTVTEFSLEGERRFTGVLRDTTERKRLQSQFIQAQKMEAVGRLAGGVAHDFNNLLTIISGYCELLLMSDLPVGDKRRESIATIRDAGERAARLTQQLLAFSRKAVFEPKLIDLNELVTDSVKLLRRLIGEDIILVVITFPKPTPVKADPGQFEQVIMNLVVNARDAMPTGGRLTIETSVLPAAGSESSLFACLAVSDTGQGVSDEVKEKIFEPFFTTKGVGKGTGLGLAVVHGVVTQSGGQITMESSVGVGTTFRVVMPMVSDSSSSHAVESTRFATRGTETVLLVEDDKAVRRIAKISLQSQGYKVLEASDGSAGLRQAETYPGEIHLLISDVVMPEIGGRQLLDAVRKHRPGLRVLFMSGYTDDAVLLHGVVEATDAFIQKPFTPLSLARKVREVIDAT